MNQLDRPVSGEPIAIIKTTMGDVSIRLFPEFAPKTVENFTTHAKNGYYNGLIFHRVIKDFMIQGGDPTGTGAGGTSIWGQTFEDECCVELRNYRGALSMANAGANTNGSQFFIVDASTVPSGMLTQMKQMADKGFPAEVTENYEKLGGTPWLDFKHTVFGQVFDGMDTVAAISDTPVNGSDRPVDDVKIMEILISKV